MKGPSAQSAVSGVSQLIGLTGRTGAWKGPGPETGEKNRSGVMVGHDLRFMQGLNGAVRNACVGGGSGTGLRHGHGAGHGEIGFVLAGGISADIIFAAQGMSSMIDRNRVPDKDWHGPRLRIGAVSYLNSKPLVHGLPGQVAGSDLILDYPSRLADELARGRLDVALIPSVEAFSDCDYEVVSDACVATHGAVHSVKLFSRVHPGAIRSLALDEGSRTSAALTRVMLEERFGVRPQLQSLPMGASLDDCQADAVLLIGDRAMFSPVEHFHTIWDLGEEWVQWTGLPFVFAMWTARKSSLAERAASGLSAARDAGLAAIEQVAQAGAGQLKLPYEMVHHYLTRNLHFRLGPAERSGLRLFQELAARHGLAGAAPVAFQVDRLPREFAAPIPAPAATPVPAPAATTTATSSAVSQPVSR